MTDPIPDDPRAALLSAALPHVAFDGWSEETFRAAARDAGIALPVARAICPRGALDLAVAYHKAGDALMLERIAAADLGAMRYSDRIAAAVRFRLDAISDKEAVRRATAFFALPPYAAEGASLVWGTADAIWTALGDTSQDINWYTKRATLSGVYGATVLYWLGDTSFGHAATWEFLERRIANVLQIETLKARVNANPVLKGLMAGPNWLFSRVRAPGKGVASDLPGSWTPRPRG